MKNKRQLAEMKPVSDTLNEFETTYIKPSEKIEQVERVGVWAEPQLYLLPFCVPQDRLAERFRSIKISETIKINDQVKHRSFMVNPHPELGLPGSFELEVMTGIYKLADDYIGRDGIVPDFIELGTFRSFLELIGRPCTGKYVAMLKEALRRLAATTCISEGFFYSKPRDLYVIESFTFITSLQIAGETDFNGTVYEKTKLRLHEFIRENLNSNFRTLIDFDYLRSLQTSIAKSLALHLAYRVLKNGKGVWEADYSWLAERLAVKVYADMWRAKGQLKSALTELKETGFLASWEWLKGARIRFIAGDRLVLKHKERVAAKDAWLAHQENEVSKVCSIIKVKQGPDQAKQYDPLAPLCAEYALKGWDAVANKAHQKKLDEKSLKDEALKRGHSSFQHLLDK